MANAFWHGFADMHAISKNGPLVMTKGEGSWVWDEKGKKYFDAAGALWYMNVGHGRKKLVRQWQRKLATLPLTLPLASAPPLQPLN